MKRSWHNLVTMKKEKQMGFTIVELLIVIVVIGILASITVVAFSGIQQRAQAAKRDGDVSNYYKAVLLARENTGKVLAGITGHYWSIGYCTHINYNPDGVEPRDLPKTHVCWTQYYDNLAKVGAAAQMNLDSLRAGDTRGNPYVFDENEGEGGNCNLDALFYFNGSGVSTAVAKRIPLSSSGCL